MVRDVFVTGVHGGVIASRARRLTDREAQVHFVAREASHLIAFDDAGVLADFVDLCYRTADWLPAGHSRLFSLNAADASCSDFSVAARSQ